jgi:uncharacterized membrane protein
LNGSARAGELIAWILLGLAAAGAAISVYFTLVYYGRVVSREVPPALCQREEQTCVTILQTPYARLVGVPNALLGLAFYALTLMVAALGIAGRLPLWLWQVNILAAAAAVLAAPYLTWALVAQLKTWCRL